MTPNAALFSPVRVKIPIVFDTTSFLDLTEPALGTTSTFEQQRWRYASIIKI